MKFLIIFLCVTVSSVAKAEIKISLKTAMLSSIKENLDLKSSVTSVEEKKAAIDRAQGEFDTNITLSVDKKHSESPSSSSLDGVSAGVISDDQNLNLSASTKSRWGTDISVPATYGISESNSSYALLPKEHNTSLGISLSQPLSKGFDSAYFRREIERANLDLASAREKHGEKIEDTAIKAAELFLDSIRDEQTIRVRDVALKNALATEEFVRAKFHFGKASSVDLLEAETASAKARDSQIAAQIAADTKRDELMAHIFGRIKDEIKLNDDLSQYIEAPKPFDLKKASLIARSSRPQIKALEASLTKAQNDVTFAKKDLRPGLDLKVTATNTGLNSDFSKSSKQVASSDYSSYSASLNYSQNLHGYATESAFASKKLQLEQQRIKLAQLERDLILDLKKYHRQLVSNWERLKALEQASRAQHERIKAQQARFQAGKLSVTDLNRSQQEVENTDIDLIKARLSYVKSHLQLLASQGKLIEEIQ